VTAVALSHAGKRVEGGKEVGRRKKERGGE
jgi:hypothetical protein